MSMQDTLDELERRRLGFKDRRDKIDEELAARRAALLAEETSQINDLIAKARAQGASLGAIKRAYGTKDHRTITTIVAEHSAEIEYWRDAILSGKHGSWFSIEDNKVTIKDVVFEILKLDDGSIMLSTDTPRWNDDFTVENEIVRDFDGKSEEDEPRVAEIGEAFRK